MEVHPMPREESERRGLGRDCIASYVVARLQEPAAIFDLDPVETFKPHPQQQAIEDNRKAEAAGDIWE